MATPVSSFSNVRLRWLSPAVCSTINSTASAAVSPSNYSAAAYFAAVCCSSGVPASRGPISSSLSGTVSSQSQRCLWSTRVNPTQLLQLWSSRSLGAGLPRAKERSTSVSELAFEWISTYLVAIRGLYNRQNQPPPYKRQKPNPPVITKYPLPPHLQQSQGSTPQGCAVPYGQPGYSQHPAPQAPPTPMSAHSPSYHQWQQWQQKPHSQQYQNANHQHNSYSPAYPQGSQGNYQQQQPNMPTAPPTPATPHGAYSMNQGSPPAVQGNSASYFHNISHQGTSAYPIQQHFGVSPASAMSPRTSYQQHQNPTINASRATEAAVSQHGSRNSSVSMRSLSATPKPQPVEVAGDPLEDDLDKLNVPDIPTIMSEYRPEPGEYYTNYVDGAFAKLVDRPLPANFVVADALEPFDPPQPENDGRCQSRYTKLDGSSTFLESVRNTRHWEDLKKDPIFLSISNDGKILSLESIGDINKAVNADEDQVLKTPEEDDRNHSAQRTERRSISLDAMGRYEHSWQPGQTGAVDRHFTTSREPISLPSTRSQNKRPRDIEPLASPGATVLLKPVREISLPRPPPPVSQGRQQSPEYTPPPRTRTPSMYEL